MFKTQKSFRFIVVALAIVLFTFPVSLIGQNITGVSYDPSQDSVIKLPEVEMGEMNGPFVGMDAIAATTYTFSAANGVALEDMSSGTTRVAPPTSDDFISFLQNIG